MQRINESQLEQLTIRVLERTAMVLADPIGPNEANALTPPTRFSCLSYCGDASGTLYLSASDGFLAEIASSLLGVEPEEICLDVDGKDALNEMANIITGSLILQLGGDTESISLGLPRKLEKAHEHSEESDIVEGIVETCGQVMRVTWVPGDAHEKSAA